MEPKVFIETPRLILREWIVTDVPAFISLNTDAEVMEFFPSLKTADETIEQVEWISSHIEKHGYGFFAVERKDNNQFIGFTCLAHPGFEAEFTPCIEIGWRLSRENWGHGFATEATNACLKFGFDNLKAEKIYSFTSVHNIRSEQVMKKTGMIKEGYFEHPLIEDGHFLKKHVLYKIIK